LALSAAKPNADRRGTREAQAESRDFAMMLGFRR